MISIKKEDLVKTLSTTPTQQSPAMPSTTLDKIDGILKQIDTILNNPLIAKILTKWLKKFGVIETSSKDTRVTSTSALTPTKIYDTVLKTIETIILTVGNLRLSEVKEYMVKNKESIIDMIGKGL